MQKQLRGSMLIIAAMLIWSSGGIFVRLFSLDAHILLFFSALFTVATVLPFCLYKGIRIYPTKYRRIVLIYGVFMLLNVLFLFMAYQATTIANATLTHYIAPVVAALGAVAFLREKAERVTFFALALSLIGLFLLVYNYGIDFSSPHLRGIVSGLTSGFFYGVNIVLLKRLSGDYGAAQIILWSMAVVFASLLPFSYGAFASLTIYTGILLLLYTVGVFIIPMFLFANGVQYIKAQHIGIIAYIEPVGATLLGYIIYHEALTIMGMIGGMLILLAGWIVVKM